MAQDNSDPKSQESPSLPFQDIVENSRIIAETASDAIITINEDSRILFVNRAAVKVFGYSVEELLGAELIMLMPEYLRHLHRGGLKRYVKTGKKHISWEAVELTGLHKSGKEISLELSFGEFSKDGNRFFTGIARDITRRKQDERRLALQHAVTAILAEGDSLAAVAPKLLKTICANLGWQYAALWSVDSVHDTINFVANWRTHASPGVIEFEETSRQSHFSRDEGLPGKAWGRKESIWVADFGKDSFPRSSVAARGNLCAAFGFPIVLGEEIFGVIELFSEKPREPDPAILETLVAIGSQLGQFIERKNGEEDRLRALAGAQEARLDAEALAKQLAAVQRIVDVSLSHLSVDEVIAESLNRLQEVLGVDTVAILLLRTEGDELFAWKAQGLEEEVELGVRIPVGKGFAGKVIAERKPIIIEDVSQADLFNPLLRKKGIKSLLGVPLMVEGQPTGVIHVGTLRPVHFTDTDVRILQLAADRIALAIENARLYQVEKGARAEAEAANRAKDEFLTTLSHELRTPLTPIIGWVHMMEKRILPAAEFTHALSVINRNAYSLKLLINDLLDMSAILSGKMRIEETLVSLSGVLEESVETMRSYAQDSKIELRLSLNCEPDQSMIKGDRSRLNQAFSNILHNAVKFSPAGSAVDVDCETSESEAIVRITDQGQGIPPEFLPYVFERFRQADGSSTRAFGGLGLGLALVKSFVEAHGGTVIANSKGEGQGSAFIIKLPRQTAPPEGLIEPEHTPDRENKKARTRILIVEDQPDTLEMLAAHFGARGYETLLCNSAVEALQRVEREHFDILISDIAVPTMDGLGLIESLRQKQGLENIPAIALTGYASQNDANTAIAAGFDLHISKPVDPDELTIAVERLLDSRPK